MKKFVCLLILVLACTFCLSPMDASATGGTEAVYFLAGATITGLAALTVSAACVYWTYKDLHHTLGRNL